MASDINRTIDGYEVIHAVRFGGGEIILAENQKTEAQYMVCDSNRNNPLGIEVYSNALGSTDFVEIMKLFAARLSERVTALETEREMRGIPIQTLTAADCHSIRDLDIEGCVVVIKPESLAREYRTIDNQLALCTGGFGASPTARGRTVFLQNLITGKTESWQRQDVAGMVSEERLPDWARVNLAALRESKEKTTEAPTAEPLGKDKFWRMIDEARGVSGFWQNMKAPLTEALTSLDEPDIIRFRQIFNEYHGHAYKNKLWAAATIIQNGCSDDGFSDFRSWLIAQGKEVYLDALANPDSLSSLETLHNFSVELSATKYMPPDGYFYAPEFEGFMHAADGAYTAKLGSDADMYDVIGHTLLSEQEKTEILGEITYAADIHKTWGGRGVPIDETEAVFKEMCPKLYGIFREPAILKEKAEAERQENPAGKESVLDKIKQDRQDKQQTDKQKPKKSKKDSPEL